MSDFIVIDPQWLPPLLTNLISNKHIMNGVFLRSNLYSICEVIRSTCKKFLRNFECAEVSETLYESLMSLLQKSEVIYVLPTPPGTNQPTIQATNYTTNHFCVEGDEVQYFMPTLVQLEDLEQNALQSEVWMKRIYRINFLPFGFWNHLIIRLLHFTT